MESKSEGKGLYSTHKASKTGEKTTYKNETYWDEELADYEMKHSDAKSYNDQARRAVRRNVSGDSTESMTNSTNLSLDDSIDEADREFEALMKSPNQGTSYEPTHPQSRKILSGFRINMMNMRDANTGKVLWSSRDWNKEVMFSSTMEEWFFTFGFVIPGSTNSWQQTIYAAPPNKMLSPSVLSGNTTIETSFYDGESLLGKTLMRLYYV